MKFQNKSSRLRQRHTPEAESLRKALIADLISQDNVDVESMIDKANKAFASLSLFHIDFQ